MNFYYCTHSQKISHFCKDNKYNTRNDGDEARRKSTHWPETPGLCVCVWSADQELLQDIRLDHKSVSFAPVPQTCILSSYKGYFIFLFGRRSKSNLLDNTVMLFPATTSTLSSYLIRSSSRLLLLYKELEVEWNEWKLKITLR